MQPVFEPFYRADQRPPWDLDGPTPFVTELEAAGAIVGEVLDAGCGTGENALYLASRGHHVVGIDSAPTAIARARSKAAARGVPVTFVEADACAIPGYSGVFDTVVDCGFFHVLAPEDQTRYAASLLRATRPGATLHLMAFSDKNAPRSEQRPEGCYTHGVSEAELQNVFGADWHFESLGETVHALRGGEVQFLKATLRRN